MSYRCTQRYRKKIFNIGKVSLPFHYFLNKIETGPNRSPPLSSNLPRLSLSHLHHQPQICCWEFSELIEDFIYIRDSQYNWIVSLKFVFGVLDTNFKGLTGIYDKVGKYSPVLIRLLIILFKILWNCNIRAYVNCLDFGVESSKST